MKMLSSALCVLSILAIAAAPAGAQQVAVDLGSPWAGDAGAIPNGTDAWRTVGNGWTYYSFEKDPLPADFLCPGSEPFTGIVYFEGRPVATHPAGAFGAADTIVERIDQAEFLENGWAETRVVVRALSLVSSSPVETRCGDFDVIATLAGGDQPVRTMRFRKTVEAGNFAIAPLDLNVKLAFTPVGGSAGSTHEIITEIRFPGMTLPWQPEARGLAHRRAGMVMVDSDGDGTPDFAVPGARNLTLGHVDGLYLCAQPPIGEEPDPNCSNCHLDPSTGKQHCYY